MKKLLLILLISLVLVGCTPDKNYTFEITPSSNIIGLNEDFETPEVYLIYEEEKVEVPIIENNIDNTTLGEYEVVFQKTIEEKTYTTKLVIVVIDKELPTATLNPGVDTITVDDDHEDAGITVSDNIDTDLDIDVYNTVDTTTAGTYTITYVITDDYYNQRTIVRYVHVVE